MPLFLLVLVVLFVALPIDAQYLVVGAARGLVTHPYFPYVAAGAFGTTIAALFWYSAIWNALAYRLYLDDVAKADDMYRRRRR
jgi:hypothetical protein